MDLSDALSLVCFEPLHGPLTEADAKDFTSSDLLKNMGDLTPDDRMGARKEMVILDNMLKQIVAMDALAKRNGFEGQFKEIVASIMGNKPLSVDDFTRDNVTRLHAALLNSNLYRTLSQLELSPAEQHKLREYRVPLDPAAMTGEQYTALNYLYAKAKPASGAGFGKDSILNISQLLNPRKWSEDENAVVVSYVDDAGQTLIYSFKDKTLQELVSGFLEILQTMGLTNYIQDFKEGWKNRAIALRYFQEKFPDAVGKSEADHQHTAALLSLMTVALEYQVNTSVLYTKKLNLLKQAISVSDQAKAQRILHIVNNQDKAKLSPAQQKEFTDLATAYRTKWPPPPPKKP